MHQPGTQGSSKPQADHLHQSVGQNEASRSLGVGIFTGYLHCRVPGFLQAFRQLRHETSATYYQQNCLYASIETRVLSQRRTSDAAASPRVALEPEQ